MINPWFVFIESNSTGTGSSFAIAAREMGYRPIVLARDPHKYSFLNLQRIDSRVAETSDITSMRRAISELSQQAPIAGIYSSSEYFVEAASILANDLDLAGASSAAISVCRNKWRQRLALRAGDILVPKFHLVRSIGDVDACIEDVGLPCILKPTSGTGSVGVRLCRNLGEAKEHALLLLERKDNERGIPIESELLIEEYVLGDEYSVETFSQNLVGITRKHLSPEPYFVETGHDFPAILSEDMSQCVGETVLRVLSLLGLTWGPAHTEIRLTKKGPVIIEVNPRLAGGLIPELVRLATGISLISATVAAATNSDFNLTPRFYGEASIRFLIPQRSGTLVSVDGLEDVLQMDQVVNAKAYYESGHECLIQNDFRDRLGHVISIGNASGEASIAADAALELLQVRLKAHSN